MEKLKAIIRKVGSQYCLYSHKGKRLSCHPTREAAMKRERQINFFKHQKGSIQSVISFIQTFGLDFNPEDFSGNSLEDMVRAASTVKQTVIVKKGAGCANSRQEATTHAKSHGKTNTIRETGDSYRFRQRPPSDFDQKSFRTISVSKCVSYVIGKLKGAK